MLTAAFTNDLALLKTASAEGLRCCDGASRTPLHYAAAGDHDECVEWLLAGPGDCQRERDSQADDDSSDKQEGYRPSCGSGAGQGVGED